MDPKIINDVIEGATSNKFTRSTPSLSYMNTSTMFVIASENATSLSAHILKSGIVDRKLCDTLNGPIKLTINDPMVIFLDDPIKLI